MTDPAFASFEEALVATTEMLVSVWPGTGEGAVPGAVVMTVQSCSVAPSAQTGRAQAAIADLRDAYRVREELRDWQKAGLKRLTKMLGLQSMGATHWHQHIVRAACAAILAGGEGD